MNFFLAETDWKFSFRSSHVPQKTILGNIMIFAHIDIFDFLSLQLGVRIFVNFSTYI